MTSADPGRTLGKYQLIAELARGGMAIVYLALVQGPGGFNKLVVVKQLRPELADEPAYLTMFLDEARLAARLSHSNIVQTNEVGSDGNRCFLAMEYLDGRGLDRVRRRARTANSDLSLPIHLRVLCDMLAGLHYAHTLTDFDGTALSIVHRDVSPQNVFVTFDGQVKLLDFGIAKASDSFHETRVGVLKGKVSYMSPEQAKGQKVDARADVFSAGVMLWEALTGRRLREGQNDQQMLWALASGDLPRASSVKPWVPPELDAICARAMAWDREQRYPSAGELQHEIEHYLAVTGAAVTAREVGLCVSELFRDERVTINGLIESHLARVRSEPVRDALPVLDVASRGVTPSHERELSPGPRSSKDFEVPRLSPTETGHSAPLSAPTADHSRSRVLRRRVPIIAGVALVGVAAGAMAFIGRTGDDLAAAEPRAQAEPAAVAPRTVAPPAASTPSPTAPPIAPAPPPAAAPPDRAPLVTVRIHVSPDTATVAVDGAEVAGNPFSGKYVGDGMVHQVRASASGFVTKTLAVEFSTNVTLDVSLERIAPRVVSGRPPDPPRPAHPPPAAHAPESARVEPAGPPPRPEPPPRPPETKPAADPDDVNPKGGTPPRRPIDPNDPYGGEP